MTQISRRTLAKGAAWAAPVVAASATVPAWAAPVVAASATVPAYAASFPPYGALCDVFFGSGNRNAQRTTMGLSVITSNGQMKAGETVTWVFNAESATVPDLNYSKNGRWVLSVTPPSKQQTKNGQFTVTLTANTDITANEVNCNARLLWDGTASHGSAIIDPNSRISVVSSNGTKTYQVAITTPLRDGDVRGRWYEPVRIDGSCHPTVKFGYLGGSTKSRRDTHVIFNGQDLQPNSDDGNDQPVLRGTCEGSEGFTGTPRSGDISTGG
ncbi:hypothetical protein ACN08X_05290 [Rothia sp. P6271]|uniref:hypothetical protein n=1 Tax=Rothia sp. P6271 TaxID=3402659 RepID=UPI003AD75F2A